MSEHSDYSYTNSRSHTRSLSQSYTHSHSHSHSRDLAYRTANEEKNGSSKQAKKLLDSPGSKDGGGSSSRSAVIARGSTQSRVERDREVYKPKEKWANIPAPLPPSPQTMPFQSQQVVPQYFPQSPVVASNTKKSRNGSQLSMPLTSPPHHYLPHQPTTPPTARFPPPPQRVLSAPMTSQFIPFRELPPSSPSHASFSARGSASRPSSSGGMHHQLQLQDGRRPSRRGSKSSPKKPHKSKSNQLLMQRSAWPPAGYTLRTRLPKSEMRALVGSGALEFEGQAVELPFTDNAFRYYAITHVSSGGVSIKRGRSRPLTSDTAPFQDEALRDISLSFMGGKEGSAADGSLEYPNMLYAFGKSPGTTTLTWYVGMKGQLRTPVFFSRTSETKKRKMKLISILERLNQLTREGLEQQSNDQYAFLYEHLIEDPERDTNPHFGLHLQIIDLMKVLMNKEWTDFSLPKNQVVAKFFDSSPDDKTKQRFFHQLLLAVELHLRIQDNEHRDEAKRELLAQLPPKVLWDLALAQRWMENMAIHQDALNDEDSEFTFHLSSKRRQREALRHFARVLKWPNMEELENVLDQDDFDEDHSKSGKSGGPLEEKSADAMSYFTGVILPGPTLPFLIMNTLIDCDEDTKGRLAFLTHVRPNSGFQYRANTYWSYKCVLGKVLGAARGVRQVAGWIGPCHFSPDLARTQCALIRTKKKTDKDEPILGLEDVEDMDFRSDVLGQGNSGSAQTGGGFSVVGDYDVPVMPSEGYGQFDAGEDGAMVRIQKIAFKPSLPEVTENGSTNDLNQPKKPTPKGPKLYDAAVVFAIAGGANVPMRLRYDVDFVQAPICENGPHALWRGYKTKWARVDSGGLRDMHGLNSPDFSTFENSLNLESSKALALALGTSASKRTSSGSNNAERPGDYYQYDIYEQDWDKIDDSASGMEHLQYYLGDARDRKHRRIENSSSRRRKESNQLVSRKRDVGHHRRDSESRYNDEDEHFQSDGQSDEEEDDSLSSNSDEDSRPILLIDATGVSDNEVFARAWCSHWGLDAVVANISRMETVRGCTCVACAVRLAIAARIGVVIFTEGGLPEERDRGVWEGDE